jgi:formamidopyrimidine-DNA glycosylase
MPELPELEIMKSYLDATALHQKIAAVQIEDDRVLEDMTTTELRDLLVGQAFQSSRRCGKYLLVELSNQGYMVLHFGMTGDLKYYKIPKQAPEYELVRFEFQNNYQLAYVMPRKLGHIYRTPDVETFIAQKDLGPDVCAADFAQRTF